MSLSAVNQKSVLGLISATLGPYEQRAVRVTGSMFQVKESSDDFEASFDGQSFFPLQVGLGVRLVSNDQFTSLWLRNPSASSLYLEIYHGSAQVIDSRLNTVATRLSQVTIATVSTRIVSNSISIIAGNVVNHLGTNGGQQRIQVVITNTGSVALGLKSPSSPQVGATIYPNSSFTLQGNFTFGVWNQNVTAGSYQLLEIYPA